MGLFPLCVFGFSILMSFGAVQESPNATDVDAAYFIWNFLLSFLLLAILDKLYDLEKVLRTNGQTLKRNADKEMEQKKPTKKA